MEREYFLSLIDADHVEDECLALALREAAAKAIINSEDERATVLIRAAQIALRD